MKCLSQCLLQFLETSQDKTLVGEKAHTRPNRRNLSLTQRHWRLQENESISSTTAHKFESAYRPKIHEWRTAISRRRSPKETRISEILSAQHFSDLLKRDFTVESKNKKWAVDFTYLYLKDGSLHYNCTIIDLYDRSVVASVTDSKMMTSLAVRTLKEAVSRQKDKLSRLILHSDQGS